jgi:hypothetical protein
MQSCVVLVALKHVDGSLCFSMKRFMQNIAMLKLLQVDDNSLKRIYFVYITTKLLHY